MSTGLRTLHILHLRRDRKDALFQICFFCFFLLPPPEEETADWDGDVWLWFKVTLSTAATESQAALSEGILASGSLGWPSKLRPDAVCHCSL